MTDTPADTALSGTDARIRPVRQRRAIQRQRAILDAGRKLLHDVPFDTLRMEQIATEAGCSVGTLYQRFKDKDALLDVIMEEVVAELDQLITDQLSATEMDGMTADAGVHHVVAITHGFLNDNQGLVRAIMARQLRQPDAVSHMRLAGARLVGQSFAALSLLDDRFAKTVDRGGFQFAMQTVIGTLNNAILNQPGPYQIEDPEIVIRLSDTVRLITGLQRN
ncbi:MAG: helix-turn-helix domain containing protein [Minwuia sp.]|nr:helix-turn-helix domain containing protein [Minwuia sp.]